MRMTIAITASMLLLVVPASGQEQTKNQFCCEGYVFFARRSARAGANVAGLGGDLFVLKGLAAGADFGTTVGDPDNRITIGSLTASYHFLRSRPDLRAEPFFGIGYSALHGSISTHGIGYSGDPGQDRKGPHYTQGLIAWPAKHFGIRFEVREYRMFVSYGTLADVFSGTTHVEFRIGLTLR